MSYETVLLPKWLSHQGTKLAKEQLHHSYTFWTMSILIFSPVYFFLRHPLFKLLESFKKKNVLMHSPFIKKSLTYHSISLLVIFVHQENELQTIVPEEIVIFFSKLFCPIVRKSSSSDWEKLLKFESLQIFLRSLEQLIQTVKGKVWSIKNNTNLDSIFCL